MIGPVCFGGGLQIALELSEGGRTRGVSCACGIAAPPMRMPEDQQPERSGHPRPQRIGPRALHGGRGRGDGLDAAAWPGGTVVLRRSRARGEPRALSRRAPGRSAPARGSAARACAAILAERATSRVGCPGCASQVRVDASTSPQSHAGYAGDCPFRPSGPRRGCGLPRVGSTTKGGCVHARMLGIGLAAATALVTSTAVAGGGSGSPDTDRRLPEGRWLPAGRRQRFALSAGREGGGLERPRACRDLRVPPGSRPRRTRRTKVPRASRTGRADRGARRHGRRGPRGIAGSCRTTGPARAPGSTPAPQGPAGPPGPPGSGIDSIADLDGSACTRSDGASGTVDVSTNASNLIELVCAGGVITATTATPPPPPPPPPPPAADLVINEIDYDQVGADTGGFVEIKNIGSDGAWRSTASRSSSSTAATARSTTASSSTGTLAAGAYLAIEIEAQNGAPDGVALVDTAAGALLDALSYEGAITAAVIDGADVRPRRRARCCRRPSPTRTRRTARCPGSRTARTTTTLRLTGSSRRRRRRVPRTSRRAEPYGVPASGLRRRARERTRRASRSSSSASSRWSSR